MLLVTKECTKCGQDWPLSEYRKNANGDSLRADCKECGRKQARAWNKNNPHKRRGMKLKSTYGITNADYEILLAKQGGVCGICGTSEPGGRTNVNFFHVDHCHTTGQVRGLLCLLCNRGLGSFKDNLDNLNRAAQWLKSAEYTPKGNL